MKITLVQPTGRGIYGFTPEPPVGLASLAACLESSGLDVCIEIIDGCILDQSEYAERISSIRADVVGVTTTTSQLDEALQLPSRVESRDARFIIGGSGVRSVSPASFLESGYAAVAFGEGDRTIVELVDAVYNGLPLSNVSGISYLSEDGMAMSTAPRGLIENLDELPIPARHLLLMERYLSIWEDKTGVRTTHIITSRGCPFTCGFCDKNVYGKRLRLLSPQRVVEEMRQLYDLYGVDHVYFEQDILTFNRKALRDLCEAISQNLGPKRAWSAQSRVDTVDAESLSIMRDAGCVELMFGVESGSQRILDYLGKGFTVAQVEETFRQLKNVGLDGGIFLIVGVPGETQEDIDQTKELITRIEPLVVNISFLTPIPGTPIYERTKHLIREQVDFYDFNDAYEGVYRPELFQVSPRYRYTEIMSHFLNTSAGSVDVIRSIGDGSALL